MHDDWEGGMIEKARRLAQRLRLGYGYSPSLNMAAAKCLDELAAELEQMTIKAGNVDGQ